eukprot:1146449-Pelagomonas_calceolata.AAC.8
MPCHDRVGEYRRRVGDGAHMDMSAGERGSAGLSNAMGVVKCLCSAQTRALLLSDGLKHSIHQAYASTPFAGHTRALPLSDGRKHSHMCACVPQIVPAPPPPPSPEEIKRQQMKAEQIRSLCSSDTKVRLMTSLVLARSSFLIASWMHLLRAVQIRTYVWVNLVSV